MSILEQLKNIDQFSESEKHIIRFLLDDPESILEYSVKDLATACYTSASTVTRLIGKLNANKGFTHFKATFFSEIKNSRNLTHDDLDITADETISSVLDKITAIEIESIEKTRALLKDAPLTEISSLMNTCRQIIFFGFDNNLNLAKPSLYRLLSLGKQVIVHDATNAQYFQALSSEVGSVAFVISRTSTNRKLLDIVSILKSNGIPIITLTTSKKSALAQKSTYCIELLMQPEIEAELVSNLFFETSVHYVLNVLCGILSAKNHERNKAIHRVYNQSLEHIF